MSKPDRFEKIVANNSATYPSAYILKKHAVTLLRREHSSVTRMIEGAQCWNTADGRIWISKTDILAALDKRRR